MAADLPLRSPVAWARLGRLSEALARRLPTQGPPLLVLSLGRSGSTWLSATLGRAANALHLHEPLTQPRLAADKTQPTNFEVDPANPPALYSQCAQAAFLGLPAFPLSAQSRPTQVVRYPEQWGLLERSRRRLVIKEINPFACRWLLQAYRPRLIYLVRHPAAVALSNERLGFLPGLDIWRRQGEHQASAHRYVLDLLRDYPDHTTVTYEALCEAPAVEFRRLCEFAGLTWDKQLEAFIETNTADGDRRQAYTIERNSRAMVDAWRHEIAPDALAALRSAYTAQPLPWYQADRDWQTTLTRDTA